MGIETHANTIWRRFRLFSARRDWSEPRMNGPASGPQHLVPSRLHNHCIWLMGRKFNAGARKIAELRAWRNAAGSRTIILRGRRNAPLVLISGWPRRLQRDSRHAAISSVSLIQN